MKNVFLAIFLLWSSLNLGSLDFGCMQYRQFSKLFLHRWHRFSDMRSRSAAAGDSVRKPLFEQFWGSGAPIIGEAGGTGWQDWAISQQALQQRPPLPEEPGIHFST